MNIKISKIGAVVLTTILFGTAFFVPASSVNVEKPSNVESGTMEDYFFEEFVDPGPFKLDKSYLLESPTAPLNRGDNDDAGYKRDAGDEQSRAYAIYPGEMQDDWPGRGTTGKLNSGDEDWYFFSVCNGQQIEVTMTPQSGYNFDLCLWNDDEVEVATSTNGGSLMESITYTADMTGSWYIGILFISGPDIGQYSFDVSLVGQNDANLGRDASDNFNDADSITPNTYYGYLDMMDEEDWYRFNVNEGQAIQLNLNVRITAYLSDFDLYLYNPSGDCVYYDAYYYDDEIIYEIPAGQGGDWRLRVKIFPGYTDIPQPTEWDYLTYGSGAYELIYATVGSAPGIPDPIPQPDITPIAQTFKISNSPGSNEDEYAYLASVPACNYLEGGERYMAPIVYSYDSTPTNWYGDVDDTTDYLLEDWGDYLATKGKTGVEYYVNSDPVVGAAEIATAAWTSSELAVVCVDGSVYEDTTSEVVHESKTLTRTIDTETIPSNSPDIVPFGGSYAYIMNLGNKYGAINVEISGDNENPSLMGVFPHYMTLTSDWWPEHVTHKYDLYSPVTTMGVWAAAVGSISQSWDMIINKYHCDRYKIDVDNSDSVLTATVTTTIPSDLLVFLVDPDGNIRAPDVPDWNGGPINPIHEWNGIDDPSYPPDCDDWQAWEVEDHFQFTAEVLHPEKGKWTAIVVPRYTTGAGSIDYTISVLERQINQKRANAAISAANAAVIASQEHVPLLYIGENSVPAETQSAFTALGVDNVILVHKGGIASGVVGDLPPVQDNLKTMQEIVDFIKDYSNSENYITITSLKTGDGYFAPSAMLAAYHCSPILDIDEASGAPGGTDGVFIGQIGENTYCYDLDSQEFIWTNPEGWLPVDPNENSPANSVYLGSSEDIIYCKNPDDFSYVWSNPTEYVNVDNSQGSLYLSLSDKTIICIDDETGNELWNEPLLVSGGKTPAQMAEIIDTWRTHEGDYYHGNRAPGHLPWHTEPVDQVSKKDLLIEIIKFLTGKTEELPPWGLDAKRYWNEEMYDGIHSFIDDFGLDLDGQEAYCFVAPRSDIRLEAHAVMTGNESYAGHIPGETPAYTNDVIMRNVLYPALIYGNENRDVTTTQLMNYPDGGSWRDNMGVTHTVYSSRILKKAFMSHGRTYEGHCLWEAHLERMNEGVSCFYYSGHGTGGSGMSAQYFQTDMCKYPTQEWPDAWRGYMYDNWKFPRDNGRRWYNPEPPNLYDIIHYKWIDQLLENLQSAAVFYMSCSTGQQFGPMVYLDHGAVCWYGNAGSGLCPQADLLDDWFFEDALINGHNIGESYSKYLWLHQRDFTTSDPTAMYGVSSLYGDDGITTIPVIYGDPTLIIYSPEWTSPEPIDSVILESNNQQPLAPEINGPIGGKPGKELTYIFSTTDPDGDDVDYYVDWDDGDFEDWDGPYASGTQSSAKHTYSEKGVFRIKVKARDSNGAEGPWGVLEVNVPKARGVLIWEIIAKVLERFPLLELLISKLLSF